MSDNRVELLSLFAALFEGFDVLARVAGSLRSGGAVQGFIDADLQTLGNFHFEAVRVYPANLGSLDFVVPMILVPHALRDRLEVYGMSRYWQDSLRWCCSFYST